jgi:hypothetical protein
VFPLHSDKFFLSDKEQKIRRTFARAMQDVEEENRAMQIVTIQKEITAINLRL